METIESLKARQLHRLSAGIIAASLLLAMLVVTPALRLPTYAFPWAQAIHLAGVFLLSSQIALFLALQVVAGAPTRALSWLAAGYASVAVFAAGMMITFPGLLEELPGIASGRAQTSVALWILWHVSLPAHVLAALFARRKMARQTQFHYGSERLLDLLPLAVGIALAAGATSWCIGNDAILPELMVGDSYRRLATSPMAALIVALNVGALAVLIRVTQLREVLYLWLSLAMFAFTLETAIYLASFERYTLGWYVSRGLSLFSLAALMFGLMVEHFRLHRDAEIRAAFHEQAANHDPLTGLFNRRYLQEKLPEELARARRYRYPLSILMLDIDHFKQINDKHGHGAGDQCLRAIAGALARRVGRSGDFSARHGGEEFIVLLPETGHKGALDVAEEIRLQIEALHARHLSPQPMTASIGVATIAPDAVTTAEQLLASADACLYRAKAGGRNRVEGTLVPTAAG